jgi:hypothetical protein
MKAPRNKGQILTLKDWLDFLETRSSNYISALSLAIGLLALIGMIASSQIKDLKTFISVFVTIFFIGLVGLWLLFEFIGVHPFVEAMEAKRIADMIVEGELDDVQKVEEEWKARAKGLYEWWKHKKKK